MTTNTERPVVNISAQRKFKIKDMEKAVNKVFAEALKVFQPSNLLFSFNGGKDCTALLHMLVKYYQHIGLGPSKITLLYFRLGDNFPEVEEFVNDCVQHFGVTLLALDGPMNQSLTHFLNENPNYKAAFLGNRRTDPYCDKLNVMQVTDPGWPQLTRINPLLDWRVRDIWDYIFIHKVPYCKLYDQGYTSIGCKSRTQPNPYLRIIDPETGSVKYRHAYELANDDSLERSGRVDT